MSRIVRKQLFSMIDVLKETHQNLKELIENDNKEEIIGLLSECQDGAIMIGSQIEAVYGEGYECVHILEKYCETVYHIAENLEQPEICTEKYELAGNQLEEIEKAISQEIPNKLEVVFFPYKASAWDSLESIYIAAEEDNECDAYCVPIPYYDLNEDKSLGEMHDESGEYPANIPVVNWQEYDFEMRKPDIIFIHNPYDNWDTVTSVEPRFYAGNLRNYTEKLIYVPYFVLDDIKPDDQEAIDRMKHLCFLPGVIYADKVIVQSEKMRRIYINEYIMAAEDQGMEVDEEALDNKILGLGSPKFDKMPNTDGEQVSIPEEWERIIRRPDGEKKKVILYHTGINELLFYGKKMFTKIKNVLSTFKENQDNIALWWCPSPLIKNQLMTLRPELWDGYMEIVNQYREEDWGIYDDTADLERAVAVTDAYFGDWNTVVWVYQNARKPVMLQDVNR